MRIAVFSDIHGFNLALDVVIADLELMGPFDEVVVAGDLCEVGPGPAEVLAKLQTKPYTVLTGNTDADVVDEAENGKLRGSVGYVIDQIGSEGVEYLADLPFSRRIEPPGRRSASDDLLVVHANPRNLLDRLTPEQSKREVLETLGDELAGAIAFGHYHVSFIRIVEKTLLVDVSAVGNPKDGDLRCKYGILTWNEVERTWSAELRKLDYPLEATEAQIMASAIPSPQKVIAKLRRASYSF